MTDEKDRDVGALVGWTSQDLGHRITLRMQSVTTPPPHYRGDVLSHFYLMDKNQAVQLAHHLLEQAGTSPPRQRRGMAARILRR